MDTITEGAFTAWTAAASGGAATTDHLGSPRVIVNSLGEVVSRRDFMPFGEELYVNVGNRTESLKYGSSADNVRQKFTGYQHDTETNLDFAEARYYNPMHGRFTSVDPIMITKNRLRDPQSINLYAYTRNNPLKYVDPTGEYFVGTDGKRVDVTVKDGMISVGRNASKDLQRMASLINEKGSGTSLSQFQAIAGNDTKVNFRIETNPQKDRPGLLGLHQAHDKDGKALNWEANTGGTGKFDGAPAYIKDKDGNQIYQESTITIFEGNISSSLQGLQDRYDDSGLSTAEYMVATFGHEGDHNTNQQAINAIRDRQEGRTNNFNVEDPAYQVTDQSLREIRENRRLPGCFVF